MAEILRDEHHYQQGRDKVGGGKHAQAPARECLEAAEAEECEEDKRLSELLGLAEDAAGRGVDGQRRVQGDRLLGLRVLALLVLQLASN